MEQMSTSVTKGDIVNRLIERFGLVTYLEYNKFDGASYYDDVVCAHKEIAYLPERSYLDGVNIQRLLNIAKDVDFERIMPLRELFLRFGDRKFDIIFFDPVHVRPDVDQALQMLPRLLNEGGFLVIHDCNPEHVSLTSIQRRPGSWVGETYKAFALFRHFNRDRAITISEDFGVGIIWNKELNLSYSVGFDIDYHEFSRNKEEYIGLIDYQGFLEKTAERKPEKLFEQSIKRENIKLRAKQFDIIDSVFDSSSRDWTTEAEAQLFLRSAGQAFSEAQSVLLPFSLRSDPVNLRFCLPEIQGELQEIRFDFAERAITVKLDGVRVVDSERKVVWVWNSETDVLENPVGALIFQSETRDWYLMSLNHDPHVDLLLPDPLMAQLSEGWLIEVTMTLQHECVHTLLEEIRANSELIDVGSPQQSATLVCSNKRILTSRQCRLLEQITRLQQRNVKQEQGMLELNELLVKLRSESVKWS